MPTIGYQPPASGGPDSAVLDASTVIAYQADPPDEGGWLWAVAARLSRPDAGNPTATLLVYATDAGGTPTTLAAQTAAFPVTVGTEAEFQRDLTAALVIARGQRRAFAALATGARLGIDMAGAAYVPAAENRLFYWDDGQTTPPATFAVDRSSFEGQLAIWGIYEANAAPSAPATVTPGSTDPANPQQIGDPTPTLTAIFRDVNESLPNGLAGDSLKRYRFEVTTTTGTLVWNSGPVDASSAEVTARQGSLVYAGPALANGTTYRLRATVADRLDAWSPMSGYRYFVVGAGRVDTTASTPAGKQDTRTPGPFTAKWVHSGGLATKAVELRIVDAESGAQVRAGVTLLVAVAPNATISIAWATTGYNGLPWAATRLVAQIRGQDTANAWSGWGTGPVFWTDDPPAVPAPYQPAQNAVVTDYPLLQARCTDSDDAPTEVTVSFRIMNAAGSVLATRTGTWSPTKALYVYQVVAADFAAGFADYFWDAYAFDGTLYSGGATVAGSAQTSADRRLTYAQGPVVVITAPLDGALVATNTPTITWTATAQVTRTVDVRRDGVLIHRNTATTTARTYTLPSVLSTGELLHEGDVLDLNVYATDSNGLQGASDVLVTIDYPTPDPLTPTVTLLTGRGDLTPSLVRVSWPASAYPVDQFRYYRVTRTISADMLAANPSLPDDPVVFKRLEINQTGLVDYEAASGVEYTYCLTQYVMVGADTLRSPSRCATIALAFEATILHDTRFPEDRRLVFDARRDRTVTTVTDFAVVSPWNQQKPVQFESDVSYDEIDTTWVLAAKTVQDANFDLYRLKRMVADGGILCYRDGRGRKAYGRFASGPVETDPPAGRLRSVRGVFRELAYDPSAKD